MIFIFTVLSSLCAAPTAGRENISRSRLSAARRHYCELPQTLLHPNKRLFQILIPSDEFGLGSIYSLWRKTMKQKCVANVNFIWILIGKLLILKQWQNNRFVRWSNKGGGGEFSNLQFDTVSKHSDCHIYTFEGLSRPSSPLTPHNVFKTNKRLIG